MPANKHCSYGTCNTDSRFADRPHMVGVRWIPFPKPKSNREKCLRWIKNCGRKDFSVEKVTYNTYICSKHFVDCSGPTAEHPDPIPATASGTVEMSLFLSRKARPPPKERPFLPPPAKLSRPETPELLESSNFPDNHTLNQDWPKTVAQATQTDPVETCSRSAQTDPLPTTTTTTPRPTTSTTAAATQTGLDAKNMEDFTDLDLKDRNLLRRKLTKETVMANGDTSCKFYTGLTVAMLLFVFDWVSTKASRMTYWKGSRTGDKWQRKRGPNRALTLMEEFLLTLIRLRCGLQVQHLADMFGVSTTLVSRVFTTWINFLYVELKFLIKWPTVEQVRNKLPKAFKYYPKTRCIIDCSEFFIQRPSLPASQRKTWSSYKHRNTAKALIAVSPKGNIIFVSSLWSGSVSDRALTERSGFLDLLENGDDVMADRGFLIRDLLALRGATLNIPPFAFGKQLSSRATTKTRRIARARIHVERAIGRVKLFKILDGTIPINLVSVLDQVVFICCALSNLNKQLVK